VKAAISGERANFSGVIAAMNGMISNATTRKAAFSGEEAAFHRDKAKNATEDPTFSR